MKRHLLQSEIWEEFEKTEGNRTRRVSGKGWEALVVEVTRGVGKYWLVKYGPTVGVGAKTAAKVRKAGETAGKNELGGDLPQAARKGRATAKELAALGRALEELRELAKQEGAMFVRVEPVVSLTEEDVWGLREGYGDGSVGLDLRKTKNLDPEYTWVLDLKLEAKRGKTGKSSGKKQSNGPELTEEEAEILAGMESRKVRYWRNHKKKGMRIRKTQNPEEVGILARMLAGLGVRDHFTPQNEEHLKNQLRAGAATLYVVELDEEMGGGKSEGEKNRDVATKDGSEKDKSTTTGAKDDGGGDMIAVAVVPIAAALVCDFDGVRYYLHAATDESHRKLMAGTILLIQMILDAKRDGAVIYDFWGMTTSEDPTHPWYGFTQYKKSFGGREVDYAGTYDLVVDKKKYKLYGALRKMNLMMRKLRK